MTREREREKVRIEGVGTWQDVSCPAFTHSSLQLPTFQQQNVSEALPFTTRITWGRYG